MSSIEATTTRRSAASSAGLLLCWAISALSARVARSIWLRRSLIALRSGGAAASRGADFTALTSAASFSDCARAPAISARSDAIDFSSASTRAVAAGSGMVEAGLADLDSISATRDVSVSIAAALAGGAAVCEAVSPGHPTYQAAAITSAAVTAPVTAEVTIAEIAAEDEGEDRFGWGAALAPARVSSLVPFPPDTSDASRSMVGGARLARPEIRR